MTRILLIDNEAPISRPLTRISSLFSLRDGIFSEYERLSFQDKTAKFYFLHSNKMYEKLICKSERLVSFHEEYPSVLNPKLIMRESSTVALLEEAAESAEKSKPQLSVITPTSTMRDLLAIAYWESGLILELSLQLRTSKIIMGM